MPPEGHLRRALLFDERLNYALIHRMVVDVVNRRKLLFRHDLA